MSHSRLVLPPSDIPPDEIKSERQKSRLKKRKGVSQALNDTRDELFSGEFESFVWITHITMATTQTFHRLIIASNYESFSIIEKLYPYLGGSASIVVQSPYGQVYRIVMW